MHWFYVKSSQIEADRITITGSDVNHIKNVLRMVPGEQMILCDGEGTDYCCTIEELNFDTVIARIGKQNESETELPAKLYLFQGIPKKDKMELIVQKAVELGVYEIIPVAMKRCVARLEDRKKEEKKRERWQSIALSAAKQSCRGIIPKVSPAMSFKEAIAFARTLDDTIVPYEQSEGIHDSYEIMEKACEQKKIGIFIGPEGGFDDEEIDWIKKEGMKPVTLGKRILRTETAGLCVLSVLMYKLEGKRVPTS